MSPEEEDADGYTITIDPVNRRVGWFDVKAKAGANSKGEVRIKDFGDIEVKKNGDFTFTKKLTFENENLLTGNDYDWVLGVGLNEGISWLHPNRRSKWLAEIEIPNKELLDKTYNFYTYRPYGEITKVDFIVWRPKMCYKYDGKEYRYQWDGFTVDTPEVKTEAELWTDIDVTKDSAKIQGTWTENGEWDDTKSHYVDVHTVYADTLAIDGNNVKNNWSYTQTKLNGSAFTKEELLEENWAYIVGSDGSENWKLRDNCTLSNDSKTLVEKYESSERPLSEYFADYTSSSNSYTEHYDLKLFNDSLLRIIQSGKDEDGEDYEWYSDYKKQ